MAATGPVASLEARLCRCFGLRGRRSATARPWGTRQDWNGNSREPHAKVGKLSWHNHSRRTSGSPQWNRIEEAARERRVSPNRLVVELAIEALDRRQWPGTEAEIKVARASLFAAQALARGLIADGREHEVREIREFISGIVPDPDP